MEARIQECQDEIKKCDEQIPALKKNQKSFKSDLDKANAALESKKSEISTFLNRFVRDFESFKTLQSRLSDIVLDENDQAKLTSKMETFSERKNELERKKVQYETEKMNVSNKEQKVRILKDQLNKKVLQEDVATLNGELMELQEKIEELAGIEKQVGYFLVI
uniref:Uncharacterized protein n=1 Tax=Panagrolaimus superbus TaxID=310955 RepID=A0A914YGJ5_9BILA